MKSLAALLLVVFTGCVNSSTLQTAKALDPGKQRILVGGGFYASPSVDADASESTGEEVSLALPYMELGYRRGIVDKVELGAKVTLPGTAGVDAKYQLVQKGDLALAAGLGTGYLKISSGAEGMQTSTTLVDAIVPVYASYDLAKAFAVYTSPKYVLRYAKSVDEMNMSTTGINHLVGATAGVRIGNNLGLYLETSYLKSVSSEFDAFQVNGSFFF
jgi:thiazole synthase ThiGH ThiG subunit